MKMIFANFFLYATQMALFSGFTVALVVVCMYADYERNETSNKNTFFRSVIVHYGAISSVKHIRSWWTHMMDEFNDAVHIFGFIWFF